MTGIAAIFYRDYRQRLTNLGFMFWDLFAPLAYLILFGIGFDGMTGKAPVLEGREFAYSTFLVPGVLAMVSFSVAMNTAWGFFMDKDSGIFYELLTYPVTRREILIGKIAFNVLLSLIGSALVVALGVYALDVELRWSLTPLTLAVIVISTAAWFFFFSGFAIALARMDAFNTVTSASYIFLMFFSSMFYPLGGLPGWFQAISYANPVTWQVDLLRYALLGVGTPMLLAIEAAALVGFTALCLALATRSLNRAG